MKRIYLFFLSFLLTFSLTAQEVSTTRITGSYSDKALDLVLFDLKIKHGIEIIHDKEQTKKYRVTASFKKASLEYALTRILEGTDLAFELIEPKKGRIIQQSEVKKPDYSNIKPTRKDFNISGVVKDRKNGETLPFSTVVVAGTNLGANTNVDGYFTLFNVPSDTVTLLVNYLGYQPLQFRLLPDMEFGSLEILLDDFGVDLEEVIVKASKEEQMLKTSAGISRIGISPSALSKIPSLGEKDIFRSLQLLPGISGSNESSSGLFVRGGTPDQNLVLFDGFTVYHVDHLFGFFSAFNANAIKDVQLYKGGFEAKYGGRLSSVVDLTGKDGNTESFNMGAGISLLSFNAFTEFPFANGKGSVLLAGRRSFQSDFYNNIFDAYTDANEAASSEQAANPLLSRFQTQPNTYFYDLNGKVTYRPSKKDIVSLSFYNGQDDLDNSRVFDESSFNNSRLASLDIRFNSENIDRTQWGNWGSSLKWSRQWDERLYTNANVSFSNYFSERDRRNDVTVERSDTTINISTGSYEFNDLKDWSVKIDNELKVGQHGQLDFGFQGTYNDIEYSFNQNDTLDILNRTDDGFINALYVQHRHTFFDKLIVKGGLRASHYSVTSQLYLEPRANATYLINDKFKLKAAWGQYYQFANRIVREDIQQGSRDFWLLADDENVPIGSSVHYILGGSFEQEKWIFDVEAYYKTLDGLSEYSTRFTPSGFGRDQTLDYEEFFFTGDGVAKGVEFLLQRKVGKLTGWVSYTLGEVKYDFEDFSDEPFFANQDATHELKIVGNYKLGKVTLGATFIYATGRPYTAPVGFYEVDLLDGNTSDFYEISDKNALRFPNYHRFDVSATYDFNFDNTKMSLGISVFNIYNRNNVWYNEYDVIEGELLETQVSLLGFTPSLFATWSFR